MYITAAVGESPIWDRWGVATLPISDASLAQRLPTQLGSSMVEWRSPKPSMKVRFFPLLPNVGRGERHTHPIFGVL